MPSYIKPLGLASICLFIFCITMLSDDPTTRHLAITFLAGIGFGLTATIAVLTRFADHIKPLSQW